MPESAAAPTVPSTSIDDDARLESLGYRPQLNRVLGLLRELRRRVHLPVADGRHLLAVHPRRRARRARVHLADVHPADRDVLRRPRLRGAREPLPGRRRALPVLQVLGRPRLRLVRGLVLRDRAAGHGGRGRHRVGRVHRGALAQLVRDELGSDEPHDGPADHARPAGDPDHAQHHRRQGHGPHRAVRGRGGDPRDARHRDHPRDPRLPPRPRLPVLDAGGHARLDERLRRRLRRQLARPLRSIAVLAPVYIFYGFESCGDIAEETKDAGHEDPEGDALGADLGRRRVAHPDRRAAARDAGARPDQDDLRTAAASRRSSPSSRAGCRTSCSC